MKIRKAKLRLNVRRKKDTRYPFARIKDFVFAKTRSDPLGQRGVLPEEIGRFERFSFYASPMVETE